MNKNLNLVGESVEPGKKILKKIEFGSLINCIPVEIPILLINGIESGPILCLNSGLHGTEITGIEMVRRAAQRIDPSKLSGAVVAIIGSNPLSYVLQRHSIHVNPWLSYPGNPSGKYDERLVYFLFNEIFSKTNCIIDFHSGSDGIMEQYLYASDTEETYKEVGKMKDELARAFGQGLPFLHDLAKRKQPLLSCYAGEMGITEFTAEIGGGVSVFREEDINKGVKGIENVMKYLKMIEGKPEPSKQLYISQIQSIYSNHGGFLVPKVSPFETPYNVSKGEVIARITDILGNEVEAIKSEIDGVSIMSRLRRLVLPGDWIFELGSGSYTFPPKPRVLEAVYT